MGIWGLDLYQNDTSLDVKGEFEELYNASKTVRDITDIVTVPWKQFHETFETKLETVPNFV